MLPHYKVFTRLGVSKIDGIGVFAIAEIPKGAFLFEFDNTEMVWVNSSEIENIPPKLKKLYDDFCVIKKDGTLYGCPANFNQLTMAWYMNNSDDSNVQIDNDYNFLTKRLIQEGEELTINYSTFSEMNQ
jgi:SET domain-containing protein